MILGISHLALEANCVMEEYSGKFKANLMKSPQISNQPKQYLSIKLVDRAVF